MGITRWSTEIRLIIFFAAKDGEALLQSAETRLGADCGSDHKLFIAKFRLKLKKVGKTTRPFRYAAAATAAKLLQSCPTLCDPIDGSPPGTPVPGILQAGTLEWVAISLSSA